MRDIIQQAETNHNLDKHQIIQLFEDNNSNDALFAAANRVRQQYVGDGVHLRGLIEFSNVCKQNCFYCGLRRDNHKVSRYILEPEVVIDLAHKAAGYGYKTVVLQSGESESTPLEAMLHIIREIKALGLALTLSIGEKTTAEYMAYRAAGADRYLLRIETTDQKLYSKLHPGMDYHNRVRCLHDIRRLGFEVGTGSLVGLPGQTIAALADDILFFKQLDADMLGIGPFIPHPDTPLAAEQGGAFESALKVMAITRLLLPDANIPATTAMETLHPNGRMKALQCGANVVMPNVTEGEYRKLYELYPGKICVNDTPAQCRGCIQGKIEGIGRSISPDYGYRNKLEGLS